MQGCKYIEEGRGKLREGGRDFLKYISMNLHDLHFVRVSDSVLVKILV